MPRPKPKSKIVTTEAVVEQIAAGHKTFNEICSAVGINPKGPGLDFREVDKALQRARRKGLIRYTRAGGWAMEAVTLIGRIVPGTIIAKSGPAGTAFVSGAKKGPVGVPQKGS